MKKITKIISIVLLMFVLVIKVSAVTITTNNSVSGTVDTSSKLVTNTGTLSITNVDTGDTFAYYKVLDVFYNSTTNNITYEFTSAFKTFLNSTNGQSPDYHSLTVAQYQALTSGNISNGSTTTSSTLDTLMSKYAAYIKSNSISGTAMTTSSTTASATVAAGSYLVLPTSTQKVYAVMVGNVEFTGDGSGWTLNNATIVAKKSNPSIVKKIYDEESDDVYDSFSYSIGDEIIYLVEIALPTYPTNATNTTLIFEDELPSGVTFEGIDTDTISFDRDWSINTSTGVIYTGDPLEGQNRNNVNYRNINTLEINDSKYRMAPAAIRPYTEFGTVNFNSSTNKITITFNAENLESYNSIGIYYLTTLNNNATLGPTGNVNTAKMTYSNNPYGSGTTYVTDTATVYTYGIKVLKKNSSNTVLPGAQIKLCSDSACNTQVGTTKTTDSNGYATFSGLADGTYYYQEVKAPNGYRYDSTIYSVTVNTSNAYTTANLVNVANGLLPATGGIGTYIYTGVGATFIIVASVILIKRKNNKDE